MKENSYTLFLKHSRMTLPEILQGCTSNVKQFEIVRKWEDERMLLRNKAIQDFPIKMLFYIFMTKIILWVKVK